MFDYWYNLAKAGLLPEDFDQWDLVNSKGVTLAHVAAENGTLPVGFNHWGITGPLGLTVAHLAAQHSRLPYDFEFWTLATPHGWTVAHEAASQDHLPSNFQKWELADTTGWTVAHQAARAGTLPPNFTLWTLATTDGWTVAHEAAKKGYTLEDLGLLDLQDIDGVAVKDLIPFRASQEQVAAAQELYRCRQHLDYVRPRVRNYEQAILKAHKWFPEEKWIISGARKSGPILDITEIYMLSREDIQTYLSECIDFAKSIGLTYNGVCPLVEAECKLIEAEKKLMQVMSSVRGLDFIVAPWLTDVTRRDAINLALDMISLSEINICKHRM